MHAITVTVQFPIALASYVEMRSQRCPKDVLLNAEEVIEAASSTWFQLRVCPLPRVSVQEGLHTWKESELQGGWTRAWLRRKHTWREAWRESSTGGKTSIALVWWLARVLEGLSWSLRAAQAQRNLPLPWHWALGAVKLPNKRPRSSMAA